MDVRVRAMRVKATMQNWDRLHHHHKEVAEADPHQKRLPYEH